MQIVSVKREDTFFGNQFIKDFYGNKFAKFRTYSPDIEGLKKTVSGRKGFSKEKRHLLADALINQYKKAELAISNSKVESNIDLLRLQNTYTVTTGQQIHIGLGPLYVAYKTFEAIAICEELKELNGQNNYVPVFWMAAEDHDLDEIKSVQVYGKTFTWDTSQTGAVGRMNTEGISRLFEEIENELNLSAEQKEFIQVCKEAYSDGNLANSFRRLLHYYFQDEGLVIIDGDDASLKQSFTPVIFDELRAKNYRALKTSTEKLEELGVERQIVIREINLFSLRNKKRLKVVSRDSELIDEKGNFLFPADVSEQEIKSNAADFSPNAALRPLYQEWILPNLVYVGGGSEVKYWLQLKGVFDNYNLPVPLIHLRSSEIIMPEKRLEKLKLESSTDLFLTEEQLVSKYGDELNVIRENLLGQLENIESSIAQFTISFNNSFDGATITSKTDKITPKLKEMVEITTSQLLVKGKTNSNIYKVLKIKSMYFNPLNIQERVDHCIGYIDSVQELKKHTSGCFGITKSGTISLIIV